MIEDAQINDNPLNAQGKTRAHFMNNTPISIAGLPPSVPPETQNRRNRPPNNNPGSTDRTNIHDTLDKPEPPILLEPGLLSQNLHPIGDPIHHIITDIIDDQHTQSDPTYTRRNPLPHPLRHKDPSHQDLPSKDQENLRPILSSRGSFTPIFN